MAFITTLYWHNLVEHIDQAEHNIYLVVPGLDEPLSDCLITKSKESGIVIKVCIDNTEDAIRNGYGEEAGIDKLLSNGIQVRQCQGNRVSFMILDNRGFILFPESRIFSADPSGPNAVELDQIIICRLIAYYFPPDNLLEKDQLEKRLKDGSNQQKQVLINIEKEIINHNAVPVTEDFSIACHNETKAALAKNPPIEPDLQRQIKTYTAKVQFVELKFSGINFQSRTINIPEKALPIDNREFRKLILAKMKLFQDFDKSDDYKPIAQLKERVDKLRDEYLTPISCREGKSIIKVDSKDEFKSKLDLIIKDIKKTNAKLPDILEKASIKAKNLIKKEIYNFIKDKPLPEISLFQDQESKERAITELADRTYYRINFPKVDKLIEKLSLKSLYYDLTFQDFSDDKLIDELRKKKIMKDEDIKGIVEMKNAFEERK